MLNSFWWGSKTTEGWCLHWLKWDKICARKEDGGLGFRAFRLYNLLAKHGWKFFTDPCAIISKIFKAIYFSNRDFLKAKLGNNPSFLWRSIWGAQVILVNRVRWKIGDGRSLRV